MKSAWILLLLAVVGSAQAFAYSDYSEYASSNSQYGPQIDVPPVTRLERLPPYQSESIIGPLSTLTVLNGQNVHLEAFPVNNPANYSCRIQVVNEPHYSRAGDIYPQLFDCSFTKGSVWYEHNGGKLLPQDTVKMRVFLLAEDHTIEQEIYLPIRIENSQCSLIRVGTHLSVRKYKESATISTNNIDFSLTYDQMNEACMVRYFPQQFPAWGNLIDENGKIVNALNIECSQFKLRGFRYQHKRWPSPNRDFIPITVELISHPSEWVVKSERHFIQVNIFGAEKNSPPGAEPTVNYLVSVDEFILTNIFPSNLAATDLESRPDNIYFRIDEPPQMGFITHLRDNSRAIESFTMKDLKELKIAFQPPTTAYNEIRELTFTVVAIDEFFAESRSIKVWIQIERQYTDAPRVTWNTGLTLLEGQKRILSDANLRIVDKNTLNQLKFMVTGGLRHGQLYVRGTPSYLFTYADLEQHEVGYRHDDSDTTMDQIELRLDDGGPPGPFGYVNRFTIPILIMPKDDSVPLVSSNLLIRVRWGQQVVIRRHLLDATDLDTSDDYLQYIIVKWPSYGQLMFKREWDPVPWPLKEAQFYQFEIFRGHLYYRHDGSDNLEDAFEFKVRDFYGHETELHTMRVVVEQNDLLKPWPSEVANFTLQLNETTILPIGAAELEYFDDFSGPDDLTYKVVKTCHCVKCNRHLQDANDLGKLVDMSHALDWTKHSDYPDIKQFTQRQLNHLRLGYQPPIQDIGPEPIHVQFAFNVTDKSGKTSPINFFNIRINPVDNQRPSLRPREPMIELDEGACQSLHSSRLFELTDFDTKREHLRIKFIAEPKTGYVGLPLGTPADLTRHYPIDEFDNLQYCHDDSEHFRDGFGIMAIDPADNMSDDLFFPIYITPINDHQVKMVDNLQNVIRIDENSDFYLSLSNIDARDEDTQRDTIDFEVISKPSHGQLLLNDAPARVFNRDDLTHRRLMYRHRGEIGPVQLTDEFSIIARDRQECTKLST